MIVNFINKTGITDIHKTDSVTRGGKASNTTDFLTISEITTMPNFFCIVIFTAHYASQGPVCLIKNGNSTYGLGAKVNSSYSSSTSSWTYRVVPNSNYSFTYTCDSNGLVISLGSSIISSTAISKVYCYWG